MPSALRYTQLIRKGALAIYDHYLRTISMTLGIPKTSLMDFMNGPIARF